MEPINMDSQPSEVFSIVGIEGTEGETFPINYSDGRTETATILTGNSTNGGSLPAWVLEMECRPICRTFTGLCATLGVGMRSPVSFLVAKRNGDVETLEGESQGNSGEAGEDGSDGDTERTGTILSL